MTFRPLILLIAGAALCCQAAPELLPDCRAQEIDWTSDRVQVGTKGDEVVILLKAGGPAGERRIVAWLEEYSAYPFVTLNYQVIQDPQKSSRRMAWFSVIWTVSKKDFDRLRSTKKFYLVRREGLGFSPDDIARMARPWQLFGP